MTRRAKEDLYMARRLLWLVGGWVLIAAGPAPAAGPPPLDEKALAGRIDHHVAAGWAAGKVEPAPGADDAEFVRRVYLDLAGRIPSVAEIRAFLDDRRPDKRERLINSLLEGPRYVTHFAHVFRSLLLPEANTGFQIRFQAPTFEAWLRKQLARNAGYDALVRELLTLSLAQNAGQRGFAFNGGGEPSPVAFYMAKEVKPENLAAATARVFLGFRLECAQCHNHPFASWKRDQFWSLAAFFAGIQRQGGGDFTFPSGEVADRRELTIPGTERVVQAAFPDGTEPKWKYKQAPRAALADWITAPGNPYFARATVNRLWAYFFGTGLVDPVDEMVGSEHYASHPELLDELAGQFAAHQFDLKYLIRAITLSRPYQLTSTRTHSSQEDERRFARMPLRGLAPEQLFDSIAEATGFQEGATDPRRAFFNDNSARAQFLSQFSNQAEKSTEVTTSILQALSLMNGRVTGTATDLDRSGTLAAVLDAPFMDTKERVETLYLAALSRKPNARELTRMAAYVDHGGADAGSANQEKRYGRALADVFWTLLNSSEFMLNH
jgi:hypothetical protein